ncbi:MAG TPA: plastocyanin/azurin family copper-binding protein [Acidimicrobiia bacterium]
MHDDHGGDHGGSGHAHGHETSPTVAGAREIAVEGDHFRFTPRKITVDAGEDVTIALTSDDTLHDFVVKDHGHVVAAKKGKTKRGGLMIDEAGTYTFFCSVPGHRAQGMKGTIVVS